MPETLKPLLCLCLSVELASLIKRATGETAAENRRNKRRLIKDDLV